MKYTLLEIVQNILNAMGSDEVNTIGDTVESLHVANIVKECYYDLVSEYEFPEHKNLFKLSASNDNTKPVLMTLPSNVMDVESISYHTGDTLANPELQPVSYLPLREFLTRIDGLNPSETDNGSMTVTLDGSTFTFKYWNDRYPTFWTSPDDQHIIFDAYKSTEETTLTEERVWAYGKLIPTFSLEDTYIPDLDAQQHQLLLQSAKAQAFVEIEQTQNPTAERKERKHRILAQRTKEHTDDRPAIRKRKGYGRC